jgi:hypothetical protein
MSRIFAVMHFFETQAKISNDKLLALTERQDKLLKEKESMSLVVEKLTDMKGTNPTEAEIRALQVFCTANGFPLNDNDLLNKLDRFSVNGSENRAFMQTPTETRDKKNLDVFTDVISRAQKAMDRASDKVTSLNTQTQRYLTEANDAEARVSGLLADYKGLLQEMRK